MHDRPIRVVLAKLGLDGHDRGIRVVAGALRDAGMEVVYTGLWRTPEQVAAVAAQEDADVVGVSLLSGAHESLIPRLMEAMRAAQVGDVPIVLGGIIPTEDIATMTAAGVSRVLGPGATLHDIVACFRDLATARVMGDTT